VAPLGLTTRVGSPGSTWNMKKFMVVMRRTVTITYTAFFARYLRKFV
jgi:hypothetical protein